MTGWSGGIANRTWKRGRINVNRNVPGDRERGAYLFAMLADEFFWCERCGSTHRLRDMRNCRDYSYENRR